MAPLLLLMALVLHERKDLNEARDFFCRPSPSISLVDKPFPDAQIERAFVLSDRSLNEVARDFAKDNAHRGYGFGICPDGRKFVVSVPAPKPMIDRQRLAIDHEGLKACRRFEVTAILKDQDQPIPWDPAAVDSSRLAVLALTCFPNDAANEGPELWGLVAREEQDPPPIQDQAEFLHWINAKRKMSRLSVLTLEPELSALAQRAGTTSLRHPHSLLVKAKADLAKEGLEILGENRAISDGFTGLARLLWNSPQHRGLLLNAKANAIGYALREAKGQKTMVLVLGRTL
jgi:hypothetical protein